MNWLSLWRVSPVLIPFIVGCVNYKYLGKLRYLFYFVTYGVANEIAGRVLLGLGAQNTQPKSHLYTLVAFALLCLFYQKVFDNFISKKWFYRLIIFFLVFYTINLLYFETIFEYPSIPSSILAIVIVTFSILYYYKVMVDAKIEELSKEPMVWINTGILIYYTGNLFRYILFNLFLDYSEEFLRSIGVYFFILNGLFYVLIAIGFWKVKPTRSK